MVSATAAALPYMPSPDKYPFPTKIRAASYDEIGELSERPTMIGKVVALIVGQAGTGNGHCVVSPNLPRFGTPVCDDWTVYGYAVEVTQQKLRVSAIVHTAHEHLKELMSPESVYGPVVNINPAQVKEVQDRKYSPKKHEKKPDLVQHLQAIYGKTGCPTEELKKVADAVPALIEGGGYIVFLKEAIAIHTNFEGKLVVE